MEVAASAEAVALVEVVAFAGAASVRIGFRVRVAVSAISMLVALQFLAIQTLQTFATPSLSSGKYFCSLDFSAFVSP